MMLIQVRYKLQSRVHLCMSFNTKQQTLHLVPVYIIKGSLLASLLCAPPDYSSSPERESPTFPSGTEKSECSIYIPFTKTPPSINRGVCRGLASLSQPGLLSAGFEERYRKILLKEQKTCNVNKFPVDRMTSRRSDLDEDTQGCRKVHFLIWVIFQTWRGLAVFGFWL